MKKLRNNRPLQLAYASETQASYYADVHAGLRNYCDATEGVSLVRFEATTRLNLNMLNYVPVDGVCGPWPESVKLSLTGRLMPTINVSHARRRPHVPSIINDDLAVGEMAAHFLMRTPGRRLACISPPVPWQHLERAIGFHRALRREGVSADRHIVKYPATPEKGDFTAYFAEMRRQFSEFCQRLPLPAAVFCTSDTLASTLINNALDLGLRIPADLWVLGCDNEPMAQADAVMPISSIALSGRRIGWMAGECLVQVLRGKAIPHLTRVPPEHVIERETTGNVAYSPPVRKALNILQREAAQPLEMRLVAKRVGVSRRTLETAFRREVGHSPHEYLVIQRLDRARHLLSRTNLRIGDVAEECGFGDLRTLGACFRKNLGMSPRQWKKVHSRETFIPQSGPA